MKKIIYTFLLLCFSCSFAVANNIEIPENIAYYEYCYMSNQCEVPSEVKDIIVMNVANIKHGLPAIY
jgi:hypothetical protein